MTHISEGLVEFLQLVDPKWATSLTRERLAFVQLIAAENRRLGDLQREVERYLERPGCNASARKTAMERLRWAMNRSKDQ